MKNKKLTLICSIGIILILVTSILLAACAPAAPTPGAPTRIKPQVPEQKQQAPITVTPTVPTKPAKPAPAPAQEVYKWRLAAIGPAGSPLYDPASIHWGEQIEKSTNGRIEVTTYAGGVLFPVKEALESVGAGVVEFAAASGGYMRGKIPATAIDDGFPMLYEDATDIVYVSRIAGVGDILAGEFVPFGVHYLGVFPTGGEMHLMTVPPCPDLESFKGVKIRTYGAWLEYWKDLGMETVYIPHDEVYMALSLGTVQGYHTGLPEQWGYRGHEVNKYYYNPAVGAASGSFIMNSDAWNMLPEDLQQDVTDACIITGDWTVWYYQRTFNLQVLKWFDEYGLESITWPSSMVEEMRKVAEELWYREVEGDPVAEKILEIVARYNEAKKLGTLPISP